MKFTEQFLLSVRVYVVLTILTGVLYTGLVSAIARFAFPVQAKGSLITSNGEIKGSELIGQQFNDPHYFWPRSSAISYNPLPSGGSNLSVTGMQLKNLVDERRKALQSVNGIPDKTPLPPDMLFSSASGLDPHISPEAARLQIKRISLQRHFAEIQKRSLVLLVEKSVEKPQLGFLGQPRINVLKINLSLDSIAGVKE